MRRIAWVSSVAVLSAWMGCAAMGAERVIQLDFLEAAGGKEADVRKLGQGEYEWSLPVGKGQTLRFDPAKLGFDLSAYDEFRFDLKPLGSQVGLNMKIQNHPAPGLVSSWYLKFKALQDEWSHGRFDLHMDDDGALRKKVDPGKPTVRINLYRRILGFKGEPRWRKAIFRNPRLVRRIVSAEFKLMETEVLEAEDRYGTLYKLHVRNKTADPVTAEIDLNGHRTLNRFQVDGPDKVELSGGEAKTLPLTVWISKERAEELPDLYSEMTVPVISVAGVPDSDVHVLRGYRRWPMWGVVPLRSRKTWTAKGKGGTVQAAERIMQHRWPVPDFGPPLHDQLYSCKKCGKWLKPLTPTEFHKHKCPKCGKIVEDNDRMDRAWLGRYNRKLGAHVKTLARAYISTGNEQYAEKAKEILLDYAKGYPKMPLAGGTRSTCGFTRLGANSLHSSYALPDFAEGYAYLRDAPCLHE